MPVRSQIAPKLLQKGRDPVLSRLISFLLSRIVETYA